MIISKRSVNIKDTQIRVNSIVSFFSHSDSQKESSNNENENDEDENNESESDRNDEII
jgi:hypothetical protein